MKKLTNVIVLFVSGMIASQAVMASNGDSYYNQSGGYNPNQDELLKKQLIQDCGHYNEVGVSHIFGGQEQYSQIYVGLGEVSAELDRVRNIKPETMSKINAVYSDAKERKDYIRKMQQQMNKLKARNADSINATQSIRENINAIYEKDVHQLNKEDQYVTSNAINSVISLLQSDGERNMQGGMSSTSYSEWQTCKNWWQQEAKSNRWN